MISTRSSRCHGPSVFSLRALPGGKKSLGPRQVGPIAVGRFRRAPAARVEGVVPACLEPAEIAKLRLPGADAGSTNGFAVLPSEEVTRLKVASLSPRGWPRAPPIWRTPRVLVFDHSRGSSPRQSRLKDPGIFHPTRPPRHHRRLQIVFALREEFVAPSTLRQKIFPAACDPQRLERPPRPRAWSRSPDR